MKPRVLLVVSDDPRSSARPAEAVRIAAGVGVWEKAEIALYLRNAAVLVLGESVDELVDDESFTRYLPMLANAHQDIYVQQDSPALRQLIPGPLSFTAISDAQLADLAARQNYLLRF